MARCSMTGVRREPSSATYCALRRPGMEKSTCTVPSCQTRPMQSCNENSILGP